ncbi:MAG TPA: LacI family DNA-binding transcriptional regulator [Candidatus Dormibacteraeota bacterium]|nr:LacI family DNA-binding transcriptional regulator [Candidatus Dormibacteraeota bacterium]
MDGSPTITDVARRAGVSVATASRTLNGARPVGEALRDQVVAAARELGYSPNPHARALAQATDASVGVIVHDVTDPYFSEIVRGMLQASALTERLVLICNTYRDRERELAYIAHFRAQRVKALVLAGSGLEDRDFGARMAAQINAFEATGGRAVLIGRHYAPGDAVIPDNVGGARELARMFVNAGHRRIGVISGPSNLTTTHDRLAGFRMGLRDSGLELDEAAVVTGDFTRDGGERSVQDLVLQAPDLTAIFALNDVMAIGALSGLRLLEKRVPDEISLAGFDDIPIARDLMPSLTTVRVPMVQMGTRALALAMEPLGTGLRTEHLPTELVVRDSTGLAPSTTKRP